MIEEIVVDFRTSQYPGVSQPVDDLLAFLEEHRRCGKLDSGIVCRCVWMSCESGGRIIQRIEGSHHDRQNDDQMGKER